MEERVDLDSGGERDDVGSGGERGDVGGGGVERDEISHLGEGSSVGDISFDELKSLNVQLPVVKKRGRPRQIKTRRFKKTKKVAINRNICYVCFADEVSRELCSDAGIMDWVKCSCCPRWFHVVCLNDHVAQNEPFECTYCN